MTLVQKIAAFIRKPTKLQLLAERVEQGRKVNAANHDSARVKEWLLLIYDQANKGSTVEQLKPMMSCAIRGMSVSDVLNFKKSAIPQEVQK